MRVLLSNGWNNRADLEKMIEVNKLFRDLYEVASKLDAAYLTSIQYNETSFTGEEYEALMDTLIEAEKILNIK